MTVSPQLPSPGMLPAPPALSAEHQALLTGRQPGFRQASPGKLHQQLLTEARDGRWAEAMEIQLQQALKGLGLESPAFDLQGIDCRQSLCEIRVLGLGSESAAQWDRAMSALRDQDWWAENFQGISGTTSSRNGRAVIVSFLQRRGSTRH